MAILAMWHFEGILSNSHNSILLASCYYNCHGYFGKCLCIIETNYINQHKHTEYQAFMYVAIQHKPSWTLHPNITIYKCDDVSKTIKNGWMM